MRTTPNNERILLQEVRVHSPVSAVWAAYTTSEGWTAWAAPRAVVDLRNGGMIESAYEGEIGGEATNTLQIINYVPEEVLTLQADVRRNWPEILREDAAHLYNVILFQAEGPEETLIRSFGLGYSGAPEYESMMQFFIQANEGLFVDLKRYLETGQRKDWGQ